MAALILSSFVFDFRPVPRAYVIKRNPLHFHFWGRDKLYEAMEFLEISHALHVLVTACMCSNKVSVSRSSWNFLESSMGIILLSWDSPIISSITVGVAAQSNHIAKALQIRVESKDMDKYFCRNLESFP